MSLYIFTTTLYIYIFQLEAEIYHAKYYIGIISTLSRSALLTCSVIVDTPRCCFAVASILVSHRLTVAAFSIRNRCKASIRLQLELISQPSLLTGAS